jgi:hypothetical protein
MAGNVGAEWPKPGQLVGDGTDGVTFEVDSIESLERGLVGLGRARIAEAAHGPKVRGAR